MTKRPSLKTQQKMIVDSTFHPGVLIEAMDNDLPQTLGEIRKFQDKTKFQRISFEKKLYNPS